jgi:hypothetical protein
MSAVRAVPDLAALVGGTEAPVANAAAHALATLGPDGRRQLEGISRSPGLAAVHAREALGTAA